jgi:proteic killer suppression protein
MEEIRYDSKELERLCNDDRYCTGKLGLPGKKKVWARMAELEAAPTVGDLPKAGDPHPLERELEGFFAVSLDGGRRLIFKPVVPAPRDGRGRIDWRRVSRITITAIKDYHRG